MPILDDDTILEAIYENGGCGDKRCADCQFYNEWQEPHPYGETVAYETLGECTVGAIEECPAYPEYLESLTDEIEDRFNQLDA